MIFIGQSTLPSSCPVCEHTPVAAEDCKPNKSLRTTIKVFLRTEEKKREAIRLKEEKNSPPVALVVQAPVETPAPVEQIAVEPSKEEITTEDKIEETPDLEHEAFTQNEEALPKTEDTADPAEGDQDVPQQSIEVSLHMPDMELL